MLTDLLLQLSHAPYFDHPVDSVDSILDVLDKYSSYRDELKITARVKQSTVAGRIGEAHKLVHDLFDMPRLQFSPFTKVKKRDEAAYINYETALFYRNLGDDTNYLNYLKIAKLFVLSPLLELLIDYQFATVAQGESWGRSQIEKFIDIFREKKIPILEIMATFRVGEIYAGQSEYQQSAKIFTDVQKLTSEISSTNLQIAAQSNLGYVYYLSGEYNLALSTFPSIDSSNDYYQKCLILENIALVHEALGEYQKALTFWMESLNIAQDHGVQVTIPEDCIRIGNLQETKLGQPSQAKFFYKLGYDHSMEMFRR
ncbi:MAG: tetratricopeptide repeat protein, partial [FCB group bacterium]|nr:tetratricopeptide repeat protein [FCB group bacterium]